MWFQVKIYICLLIMLLFVIEKKKCMSKQCHILVYVTALPGLDANNYSLYTASWTEQVMQVYLNLKVSVKWVMSYNSNQWINLFHLFYIFTEIIMGCICVCGILSRPPLVGLLSWYVNRQFYNDVAIQALSFINT